MAPSLNTVAVLLAVFLPICSAQIELDDRFLEKEKSENDMWLIEFYAPWCGHCKKLEPIYREVAKKLRGTGVKVAKVDVTKHSDMAKHYEIYGFPTIKFIKGENVYTHNGDQTKNAIMDFVERAQKPAVQWLSNTGKFLDTKSLHTDDVFFLFVGNQQDALYQKFRAAADAMIIEGYFYAGERRIVDDVTMMRQPSLLAFKDKVYYEFSPREGDETSKNDVVKWMRSERHTAFPETTARTLFQMADSRKYLVVVIIDPKIQFRMDVNNRLKQVARNIALNHREKYHSEFQFVWMSEPEMAEAMTSSALTAPALFVLQPASRQFYVPPFHPYNVTLQNFVDYLDGVLNGTVPAQGGNGFFQRLKRMRNDIWHYLTSTWKTSPWTVVLIITVPCGILGAVIWGMCGRDSVDAAYYKALKEMERQAAEEARAEREQAEEESKAEEQKTPPEGTENSKQNAEKSDDKPTETGAGEKEGEETKKNPEEEEEGEKKCCGKPKGKEEKKND